MGDQWDDAGLKLVQAWELQNGSRLYQSEIDELAYHIARALRAAHEAGAAEEREVCARRAGGEADSISPLDDLPMGSSSKIARQIAKAI